jgi:FlaA1/EpsC-like NDP-sugar epimerase
MRWFNRRRIVHLLADACLVALAWYLAFALRFDFTIPDRYRDLLVQTILVVVGLKICVFVLSGFYNHWWRYVSIRDMWSIARGVVLASILVFVVIYLIDPVEKVRLPRSVFVTDLLILLAFVTGVRLLARTLMERPGRKGLVARGKEVLVVGAGDAGQLILREMQKNPALGYTPIGLVDDDPRMRNVRLHGVRVFGSTSNLPALLADNRPDEVIIAIPSAAGETRQLIVNACRDAGVPVKTLPAVHELISGDLNLARQLREVQVEDVLGREAVELDLASIASYLNGETVLVTGAGGSPRWAPTASSSSTTARMRSSTSPASSRTSGTTPRRSPCSPMSRTGRRCGDCSSASVLVSSSTRLPTSTCRSWRRTRSNRSATTSSRPR